jgi:hypothetical protein
MINFGEGGKVEPMSANAYEAEHYCGFWGKFANDPYPMQ